MENRDTMKATITATNIITISVYAKEFPSKINFKTFRSDAPSITGIAMKNENSDAATRETLQSIPPIIVEPDREVPGINDNTWKHPIENASL